MNKYILAEILNEPYFRKEKYDQKINPLSEPITKRIKYTNKFHTLNRVQHGIDRDYIFKQLDIFYYRFKNKPYSIKTFINYHLPFGIDNYLIPEGTDGTIEFSYKGIYLKSELSKKFIYRDDYFAFFGSIANGDYVDVVVDFRSNKDKIIENNNVYEKIKLKKAKQEITSEKDIILYDIKYRINLYLKTKNNSYSSIRTKAQLRNQIYIIGVLLYFVGLEKLENLYLYKTPNPDIYKKIQEFSEKIETMSASKITKNLFNINDLGLLCKIKSISHFSVTNKKRLNQVLEEYHQYRDFAKNSRKDYSVSFKDRFIKKITGIGI